MPRPMEKIEKSKDFKRSIKKIFKSLKPWNIFIGISIILAMASAIISLIMPNKLSTLTDYITEGLKPRITSSTVNDIMNNPKISYFDKQKTMDILGSIDNDSKTDELLKAIDELPSSVYNIIKPKFVVIKL